MIKSQVCDSGASRETHTNFAVYLQRLLDIDYSEHGLRRLVHLPSGQETASVRGFLRPSRNSQSR